LRHLCRHTPLPARRSNRERPRNWPLPRPDRIKDWRAGAISRADVADFLVQQINDRALIGTTPLLIS